jgi:hypothetical protein
MKNTLLTLIVIVVLPLLTSASQEDRPASSPQQLAAVPNGQNTVDALFDLQFNYSLQRGGFAGITWLRNDYWVSKWASDSLFVVDDSTGAFLDTILITGLSQVRGMTFDGTNVYATTNSDTIYKIDTLTRSIVGTILGPIPSRGIAWDSLNGGFWISGLGSDIVLISPTGIVLNSILSSVHHLSGMYSLAYDPFTAGGPYIWAFDYGSGGVEQIIKRIPVATGIPNLVHNCDFDMTHGIAGGLTITGFTGQPHSLVGISQQTPSRLFAYELSDYVPPSFDASADTILFFPENTKQPSYMVQPINWTISCANNGGTSIDTLGVDLTVNDGVTNVFSQSGNSLSVPTASTTSVSVPGPFNPSPSPGTSYTVSAQINLRNHTDLVAENDTLSYHFSITDTTIARYGPQKGNIGLMSPNEGTVAQMFDIQTVCYVTSVTFKLVQGVVGDSVFAEIFDWDGGLNQPLNQIARSSGHVITAGEVNGVTLTLPIQNGPHMLSPSIYVAGVHQFSNNIHLAYSTFNYRPNTCWINFLSTGTWLPAEQTGGFKIVPFIDLNVWSQQMINVVELQNSVLSVYPNPSSEILNVENPLNDNCTFTITDIQGKIVYSQVFSSRQKDVINISEWSNGVYVAKAEANGVSSVSKLIVNH